jgi:hypothetical protein
LSSEVKRPEDYLRNAIKGIEIRSVLDVGTGHSGVFDYWFWESKNLEKKVCMDIHSIRNDVGWKKVIADARNIPYEDRSFDLVMCCEMIEHVPPEDHERVIRELIRVARKVVFLTSSGKAAHLGPEQERCERINPHQRYMGIVDVNLLKKHGFEILCYEEVDGVPQIVKAVKFL